VVYYIRFLWMNRVLQVRSGGADLDLDLDRDTNTCIVAFVSIVFCLWIMIDDAVVVLASVPSFILYCTIVVQQ